MRLSSLPDASAVRQRFHGYAFKPTPEGHYSDKASFYQPGYDNAKALRLELKTPDGAGQTVDLRHTTAPNGSRFWETESPIAIPDSGVYYRFQVQNGHGEQKDLLDLTWKRQLEGKTYNFVPGTDTYKAHKTGPIADIYQFSVLTKKQARLQEQEQDPYKKYRNHFNQYHCLDDQHCYEDEEHLNSKEHGRILDGLEELLPRLHEAGFQNILLKPFIGGDYSSHGYWTVDPFALNHTFANKAGYRQFLKSSLQYDMKLFCDGAFVNQGLMGLQYQANLYYGDQSPYWNWFEGMDSQKPQLMGILPNQIDSETGFKKPARQRMGFDLVKTPDKLDYQYLQLWDPQTQTGLGKIKSYNAQREDFKNPIQYNDDSVYPQRFPVHKREIQKKLKEMRQHAAELEPKESAYKFSLDPSGFSPDVWGKQVVERFRHFKNFAFVENWKDDSGTKWDGQIQNVRLNVLHNPEVQQFIQSALTYWTRQTNNTYLSVIGSALEAAAEADPSLRNHPERWVEAITQPEAGKPQQPYQILAPVKPQFEAFEAPDKIAANYHAIKQLKALSQDKPDVLPEHLSKRGLDQVPIASVPLRDGPYPVLFKSVLAYPKLQALLQEPDSRWGKLGRRLRATLSWVAGTDPQPGRSFQKQLEQQLTNTLKSLTQEERESLAQPLTQSLVLGRFMEDFYLLLLTGKTSKDSAVDQLAGLYETVPGAILNSGPTSGRFLVKGFLKRRLAKPELQRQLPRLLKDALYQQSQNAANKAEAYLLHNDSALLASAIMENREYGLNWRIDAAKDFADMDGLKDKEGRPKQEALAREMQEAITVYQGFTGERQRHSDPDGRTIRSLFPKSSIIAEWTDVDFGQLSQGQAPFMQTLLNTFDGLVNFRYHFNRFTSIIHHLPRAGEVDNENTFSPSRVHRDIQQMGEELPWGIVEHSQQVADTHDNEPLAQVFSVNPAIYEFDHAGYRGAKDYIADTFRELATKVSGEHIRKNLRVQLGETFEQDLINFANFLEWHGKDSEALNHHLDEWLNNLDSMSDATKASLREQFFAPDTLEPVGMDHRLSTLEAILNPKNDLSFLGELGKKLNLSPKAAEIEERAYGQMRQEVLQAYLHDQRLVADNPIHLTSRSHFLKPYIQALELNGLHKEIEAVKANLYLKSSLAEYLMEPSEVKGRRASLVNVLYSEDFPWERIVVPKGTSKTRLRDAVIAAYDKAAIHYGRHLGTHPLTRLLDELFDDPRFFPTTLGLQNASMRLTTSFLKREIYSRLMEPVLPKMLRTYAMQNVIPGQPSIHITQDLVAQTGAERKKNRYVQNRAPLPSHWEEEARELVETGQREKHSLPYFTKDYAKRFLEYQAEFNNIFSLKQRFPALANGSMLPLFEFNQKDSGEGPDQGFLDESGVFISPRSNGQQTVLALVNTGSPTKVSWYNSPEADKQRIGNDPLYPEIKSEKPVIEDFSLDVSRLGYADGTRFVSYKHNDPKQGIDKTFTVEGGKLSHITIPIVTVLEQVGPEKAG